MGIFSIVSAALKTAACAVRSAALAVMKFLKVLFALLVKLAALLWRQFCGFCDKHNFAPFKLLRSAGIVALIVILIFVISALAENSGLKSSQYGLADIGELGTQMYRYTQVRTLRDSQQLWGWNIPLTERECIFSYDGIVKAGYNFEDIDIDVSDRKRLVTVTLPEPYILSNEILTETLKLYDEDNNIFNPIHMEEIGAEIGDIRAQGEQEAIDNGVFEAARENAEYIIRGFLSGIFDFEVYELRFE